MATKQIEARLSRATILRAASEDAAARFQDILTPQKPENSD